MEEQLQLEETQRTNQQVQDSTPHDPNALSDNPDGYTGAVTNGKGAVYKRSDLQYRWLDNTKDKTGWGRIFHAKK